MAKKYKVVIYDSTGEDELDDVYSSLSDAMDAGCQALGEIAVGMEMLHYADSDEYP